MKKKIKEIIIVEGKDDISAVKAAVDAEVVQVNGFAIRKRGNIDRIKKAYENQGIILLLDPDFVGNELRAFLQKHFPNAKNAYISRKDGRKKDNIGVENAKPEVILRALEGARCTILSEDDAYSMDLLYDLNLAGHPQSKLHREIFTSILGIGYSNAKQLLAKLNRYGIPKEEILAAYERMKEEYERQNSSGNCSQ